MKTVATSLKFPAQFIERLNVALQYEYQTKKAKESIKQKKIKKNIFENGACFESQILQIFS